MEFFTGPFRRAATFFGRSVATANSPEINPTEAFLGHVSPAEHQSLRRLNDLLVTQYGFTPSRLATDTPATVWNSGRNGGPMTVTAKLSPGGQPAVTLTGEFYIQMKFDRAASAMYLVPVTTYDIDALNTYLDKSRSGRGPFGTLQPMWDLLTGSCTTSTANPAQPQRNMFEPPRLFSNWNSVLAP